jgi:hypothetical protein
MMVTGFLAFQVGYRGPTLFLVTVCASFLLFVLGISVTFHIRPPKARLSLRYGDAGLRLTDKPHR